MNKIGFGILIILVSFVLNTFSQINEIEKCGLDDKDLLNEFEGKYFNEVFADRKGSFDFSGKRVAFLRGSSGRVSSNKLNFFKTVKTQNPNDVKNVHTWNANGTQLIILTEEERVLCGGFDVILISWSKMANPRDKIIKLISKGKD